MYKGKNPGGERSGEMLTSFHDGPGSRPGDYRLGVEYGEVGDPSQDKLERVYTEISGYMRQLDAMIGNDGYVVSREGRITIKKAVRSEVKEQVLQIEDVLISLFKRKEQLEENH